MPIKLQVIDSYDELNEARLVTRTGRGIVNLLRDIEWDPLLHPRDRYGRFIETPDRITPKQVAMATPSTPSPEAPTPRYPNDPAWKARAGQPIKAGHQFKYAGTVWEVAHVAEGYVIVDEASGDKGKVETRILDPADLDGPPEELGGIKPPPTTKALVGGQDVESELRNLPVVNPHVDSDTHDPAIPIPEGSTITPEEWTAFGRVEQLHYTDLMKRYGPWKSGAPIAKMVKDILSEYDSDVIKAVKSAHSSQYGHSSGKTLSLTSYSGSAEKWEIRTQAMELQARIRDIISWDLYNRVHAPDVAVFHGSYSHSPSWWQKLVKSKAGKIFSAMSQSFSVASAKKFGSNIWAAPVSIRHIAMATTVTDWTGYGAQFQQGSVKENELAIIAEQVPDLARSVVFQWTELSPTAQKWLRNTTTQIKPGSHIQLLKDHIEKGGELPTTVDPDVRFPKKDALPPPPQALEAMAEYADILPEQKDVPYAPDDLPEGMPWAHINEEAGLPESKIASEAGVQAGDFMLGLKGTLYWIGPDSTDEFGLRYHKIVKDPKTGKLKFNGESYTFEGAGANKYFFLKGNVPPPAPPDAPDFDPKAWQMAAEQPLQIAKMPDGSLFKVDGNIYRVATPQEAATLGVAPSKYQVAIYDMATGDVGTMNKDYKAVRMVPAAGYSATVKLQPAKGMTLAYEGKKAVVTSVKKDGIVSIKPAGSKVVKLAPDDPALEDLFNPEEWAIADKVQVGQLYPGQYFHGGTGTKTIRPYRVLAIEGGKVKVLNIDTGEEAELGLKKAVRRLDPVKGTASAEQAASEGPKPPSAPEPEASVTPTTPPPTTPPPPPPAPNTPPVQLQPIDIEDLPIIPVFVPYKSTHGPGGAYKHHKIKDMPNGTVFQDKNGTLFKVVSAGPLSAVTDGENLYKTSGNERGKIVEGAQLATPPGPNQPAPPPTAPDPTPAQTAPPLNPAEGKTIGDILPTVGEGATIWWKFTDTENLWQLTIGKLGESNEDGSVVSNPGGQLTVHKADGEVLDFGDGMPVQEQVIAAYAITGVNTGGGSTSVKGLAEPSPDADPELITGNLQKGDEFIAGDGEVWSVVAVGESVFVQNTQTKDIQLLPKDTPTSEVGFSKPGPTAESIGDLPFDLGLTEEQLQNAPFEEMNFFSSTHGSGGKYKHIPLEQLKPGDSFRVSGDKTVWKLVKVLGGGYALVYAPNLGSVLKVKADGKVKQL